MALEMFGDVIIFGAHDMQQGNCFSFRRHHRAADKGDGQGQRDRCHDDHQTAKGGDAGDKTGQVGQPLAVIIDAYVAQCRFQLLFHIVGGQGDVGFAFDLDQGRHRQGY